MTQAAPAGFLTVGEAAARLGVSRLKLREAVARRLIPARRDNEGQLRVDLDAAPPDLADRLAGSEMSAGDLLDMLFDEVEELQAQVAEKDAERLALVGLIERQADALDRAAALMPGDTGGTERALALMETAGARLEASLGQTARYDDLLARAAALAERGAAAEAGAERAFALLDAAVAAAERAEGDRTRAAEMLGRALEGAERLEGELARRDATIAQQQSLIDRVMAMAERAAALAPAPRRRGVLGWFKGQK
ncbi:hypothetical protein DXV76_06385 [Rhodobacteraceae bacterium CCMM004]|nr:hypothetical protein DXV76_06385 [Rhodobacteraceae bacterium CCMM004]